MACGARVVDEVRRIHEHDALGGGGLGHAQDRSVVDERLVDQEMLARRDRRECDLLLGDRGGGDVDGVDIGSSQQAIDSLDRLGTRPFGREFLRSSRSGGSIPPSAWRSPISRSHRQRRRRSCLFRRFRIQLVALTLIPQLESQDE